MRVIARAPLVNIDHLAHRLGRRPTRREVVVEFFARPRARSERGGACSSAQSGAAMSAAIDAATSGYRRAPGVAVVEQDYVVYVAAIPDGPIAVLDGVAGVIWSEACDGPRSTLAERVAAVTSAAVDEIRDEVESFVDELVRRGLLIVWDA